jgi:hypothetical protein
MQHTKLWQKTGAVLALLAVLAPVWYALHFVAERAAHRIEMKEQMAHSNLQTVVIDSATIQWKKKDRELLVNNKYFDVASIRYENGKAIIRGVFDDRETEMHKAFARAQQQNNGNKGAPHNMVHWLLKLWLQPMEDISSLMIFQAMQNQQEKPKHMHDMYAGFPLLPPPRML